MTSSAQYCCIDKHHHRGHFSLYSIAWMIFRDNKNKMPGKKDFTLLAGIFTTILFYNLISLDVGAKKSLGDHLLAVNGKAGKPVSEVGNGKITIKTFPGKPPFEKIGILQKK